MRIAISGTHCSGKSTLIEDFLARHRDYVHEPEPYEWLDEAISDEVTTDDFWRQLEISVDRLRTYARDANVIAERSPIDFIAYMLALDEHDSQTIASAAELAAEGLAHIDLLVVLPLNDRDGIECPESEDLELREAMNEQLLELTTTDAYSLFASASPRIVEIRGTPEQRLRMLEKFVSP
ncbi:MAG: AAA family ATPase [Thermoanaerobaculia bacterium]